MICIATAMYCEAAPLIKELNLKKVSECHQFDVFAGDSYALIITGTGCFNAAVACTYMLSRYCEQVDAYVQFGVCGGYQAPNGGAECNVGDMFLINKISCRDKRPLYPSIVFDLDLPEAELLSVSEVMTDSSSSFGTSSDISCRLVDMEAYGGFFAAHKFLPRERIITIKLVSDNCSDASLVKPEFISKLVTAKLPKLCEVLSGIPASVDIEHIPFIALSMPFGDPTDYRGGQVSQNAGCYLCSVESTTNDIITDISTAILKISDYYRYSATELVMLRQLLCYAYTLALPGSKALIINLSRIDKPAQRKDYGRRFLDELRSSLLPE